MEKLQELLNFTDVEGKVITVFNGKMTLSQLVVGIIAILAILFVLKVFKKTMRLVLTVLIICGALIHFGIASPTQIRDTATTIQKTGIETFQSLAKASENIKVEGTSISVNIDGTWYDISAIDSTIQSANGVVTVVIDGVSHVVEDSSIISLLDYFK